MTDMHWGTFIVFPEQAKSGLVSDFKWLAAKIERMTKTCRSLVNNESGPIFDNAKTVHEKRSAV